MFWASHSSHDYILQPEEDNMFHYMDPSRVNCAHDCKQGKLIIARYEDTNSYPGVWVRLHVQWFKSQGRFYAISLVNFSHIVSIRFLGPASLAIIVICDSAFQSRPHRVVLSVNACTSCRLEQYSAYCKTATEVSFPKTSECVPPPKMLHFVGSVVSRVQEPNVFLFFFAPA